TPPQTLPPLTYPTQTIKKLHKILPPPNQYLPYPKNFLFGQVAIHQIPPPTQIPFIIHQTPHLHPIPYDVFAQAEHHQMTCTYLITQ
ncbi:histidinol dehydrogenase, partial [Staphylococcus epidermidis]|uniref:histidinol dehydrogenase n=1 Tax=Staphylococcus epidermidis TaxID=1282 RepID=UPI0016432D63